MNWLKWVGLGLAALIAATGGKKRRRRWEEVFTSEDLPKHEAAGAAIEQAGIPLMRLDKLDRSVTPFQVTTVYKVPGDRLDQAGVVLVPFMGEPSR